MEIWEIYNGGPSFEGPASSITNCYVGGRNRSNDYTQGNLEPVATRKTLTAPGKVGGLVGNAKGALRVDKSFSAADVYGTKTNSSIVGGLFGAYDKDNLQDCSFELLHSGKCQCGWDVLLYSEFYRSVKWYMVGRRSDRLFGYKGMLGFTAAQ